MASGRSVQYGSQEEPHQIVFSEMKTYSRSRKRSSYVGFSKRPYRSPRLLSRKVTALSQEEDSESTFGDDELDEDEDDRDHPDGAVPHPNNYPGHSSSFPLRTHSLSGCSQATSQWSNEFSAGPCLTISNDQDTGSTFEGVMSVTSDFTWGYSTIKDEDLLDIEQPRRAPPSEGSLGCLAQDFFKRECIDIAKDILPSSEDDIILVSESDDSGLEMPGSHPPSSTAMHPPVRDAGFNLPLNSTLLDHSRALPRPQALQPCMSPIPGEVNPLQFSSQTQTSFIQEPEKANKSGSLKMYNYKSSASAKSPVGPKPSAVTPFSPETGDGTTKCEKLDTPCTQYPSRRVSFKLEPPKPQRIASTPCHSSQNWKAPLPPEFSIELSSVHPHLSPEEMQFNDTHTVNSDEIHISTPEITGPFLPPEAVPDSPVRQLTPVVTEPLIQAEPEPEHCIELPTLQGTEVVSEEHSSLGKQKQVPQKSGAARKTKPPKSNKVKKLTSKYVAVIGPSVTSCVPPRTRQPAKPSDCPQCILTLLENFPRKPAVYNQVKHSKSMSVLHMVNKIPTDILENW